MAQLIIQIDDRLLLRLKRRAWKQGLPLQESLRTLLAVSLEEDELGDSEGQENSGGLRDGANTKDARRLLSA